LERAVIANQKAIEADERLPRDWPRQRAGLYPLGTSSHKPSLPVVCGEHEGASAIAREAATANGARVNLPELMRQPGFAGCSTTG